ncbi:MAG: S41 family peptidase [Chloroflexi bacterium]|nr:S41 family peptidase [Chloroflexota bacterium]
MSENNYRASKITLIILTSTILLATLCVAAFALGFIASDAVSAGGLASAFNSEMAGGDDSAIAPSPTPSLGEPAPPPENFSVFWEALELLQKNFDGDVPEGNEVTLAAAEGLIRAVGTCSARDEARPSSMRPPETPEDAPENFDFFWTTVNELFKDCNGDMPPDEDLVYVAIDGVIQRLDDRHTSILTPKQAEEFRIDMTGTFEGIGATVDMAEDGGVVIIHPFPESPAEKAGLRPDDVIIAVDGRDVTDMPLDEAVRLIRGPAGSKVVLTIQREGKPEPFDVEVIRARIEIPIIESEIIEDNILYVRLYDFSARAADEMRRVLEDGEKQGVQGVVFDLRGNPGGRLDIAIDIASMFIEDGVIVKETGQRNFEHPATGDAIIPDLPMVVLVDGGSASASEIVAGAIQDHGRGALIGEQTFGKGSVQSLFNLSDGAILRVTTARWFTPNGRQIEGEGLTPDIVVAVKQETEEDVQLEAALNYLREQIESASP